MCNATRPGVETLRPGERRRGVSRFARGVRNFPDDERDGQAMIDTAILAAREAGRLLLDALGTRLEIETKNDEALNLVTDADKAAEAAIVRVIRERYPDHQFLGEEGGAFGTGSDYTWIIDPLDGTLNFTHGLGIFSVSVAVEYRGEVIAGAVFDPARDELFTAEAGAGAFLNGTRLHVSSVDEMDRAMFVTGFPYNLRENPDLCLERLLAFLLRAQAVRRLGSAALDCAYVAAGRFDGFWEVALQPWDKAAGQLLITEAGGLISNFAGGPHSNYDPPFLGSNGLLHHRMVDILAEASAFTIIDRRRER
jgi:myo-inositol-1(or 4)-monophosphatase